VGSECDEREDGKDCPSIRHESSPYTFSLIVLANSK
jgi:hypothetical protein